MHVDAPGGLVVPVVVSYSDEDNVGLEATYDALPEMCLSVSSQLNRDDAPNTRAGTSQTPSTHRTRGYRLTYWLQETLATFSLIVNVQGKYPTKQTMQVVVERDESAPNAPQES